MSYLVNLAAGANYGGVGTILQTSKRKIAITAVRNLLLLAHTKERPALNYRCIPVPVVVMRDRTPEPFLACRVPDLQLHPAPFYVHNLDLST